ncbi:MAG: carboxypeptidase regulatory-like domain-containing protein [Acidobacteria bacterium]|nr:carboxypeptidase regulatory-like domain-containing protein [Acidobacteriota bacterium]
MKQLRHVMVYVVALLFAGSLLAGQRVALAQGTPTGRIAGTVADATGAVVPGAEVVVKNVTTNVEYRVTTNADGYFIVPSLPVGTYSVTVTAPNFKSLVIQSVALSAANPVDLKLTLEPGQIVEQVMIEAGTEVLINRTSETVSTTITGRQITELPITSRDALDLALTQPGVATPGRPRTSSINGLPKGSINITMDGINIQDNLLKSGDGFFAYVRPRVDAIEEVNVTTSNPGAQSAGEGAVQIAFVTKSGTNEFHGGAWWYHRNTALNSNYFFNNISGLPRQRIILNQFGWKVGGPVVKNKFFFFYSHDNFRIPSSIFRERTLLSEEATRGIFSYVRQDTKQVQKVNLLQLATQNGFPSRIDPVIGDLLNQVDQARALGTVTPADPSGLRERIAFNSPSFDKRYFTDLRLDYNITERIKWEGVVHYNYFDAFPDTLNGADPIYPGFKLAGGQHSNRFQMSTAMRATITPTMINEFRFGLTGGSVAFFRELGPEVIPGGYRFSFPLVLSPIPGLSPSRRNTPVKQWIDNLNWSRGSHNLAFGGSATLVTFWGLDFDPFGYGTSIPDVSFGVVARDPADAAMFTAANFPGISTASDLPAARSLYALLTGRITSLSALTYVDEKSRQFVQGQPLIQRGRHIEYGFYGQDSWRATPTLTLNFGLRWEYQGPPVNTNNVYFAPQPDGLWGVSGPGNMFKPGTLVGQGTVFSAVEGESYNRDWNNLAPSIGFAWTPNVGKGFLRRIFGEEGKTVFRGGYGITYTREGTLLFDNLMLGPNPGPSAVAGLSVDNNDFEPGSLLFNGGQGLPPLRTNPERFTSPLRMADFLFNAAGFTPNGYLTRDIRVPYVQQWTFSWQREVMRDTVVEVRYVGNHGVKLFRQGDLNEVNIFESGFLQEFINGQNNLRINGGRSFAPGAAGTVPLPLFTAAFGGRTNSPQFRSSSFIGDLNSGQAGLSARRLASSRLFMENLVKSGYPPNLFVVNPEGSYGVYYLTNDGDSSYHALQIDLRRRFSGGLLAQANYSFSKSLSDINEVSSVVFQPRQTLRDPSVDKGLSPFDITHVFKANWIYELPFGPGRRWGSSFGPLNKAMEGWEFHGIVRLQSGAPFVLSSSRLTFNSNLTTVGLDSGVILKGVTRQQLQKMLTIRKTPTGQVYFFPEQLVGADGKANPEFIDSPTTPGELGSYIWLYGPDFQRWDLSLVKKTRITETKNIEFRAEFLNAFNNINFYFARSAASGSGGTRGLLGAGTTNGGPANINEATFGRVFNAYQDTSTTNDPGGRIIQFVVRFNF